MNVLALEPYYGGSHQAFLDGWIAHSRHHWTLLGLPPHHWKWRMRHAAVTLAQRLIETPPAQPRPDVVFCSEMLNLAELLGLAPAALRTRPTVVYFHENQLTYPARQAAERDLHFAFTHLTTALAAGAVWFNSAYHRDEFLAALAAWLKRMPDFQPLAEIDRIRAKSRVHPPGIDRFPPRGPRRPGPLRILWAARWEYDKNPEQFFDALARLKTAGTPFRVSVLGEQFAESPPVFTAARHMFRDTIDRWGFQASRAQYVAALRDADVIVSTAQQEFFGISVVEAIAAGCWPLLPRRLAYPEVLGLDADAQADPCFYDGTTADLCRRLSELAERVLQPAAACDPPDQPARRVAHLTWTERAAQLDSALEIG